MKPIIVTTEPELNTELCKFIPLLTSSATNSLGTLVGLAVKPAYKSKVPVLALCSSSHIVIIQLSQFESIPVSLYNFLALSDVTFVGVAIKDSVAKLNRDYDLECKTAVEIGDLVSFTFQKPYLRDCGLVSLSHEVFQSEYSIGLSAITGSWDATSLNDEQIKQVAASAYVSYEIGNRLLGRSAVITETVEEQVEEQGNEY
ncbi:hypothetical protein ACHQM5_002190 [Ranunculus cassubicifolius]